MRSRPVAVPASWLVRQPSVPATREPLWRDIVGDVLRRTRQDQGLRLKDVADEARISMPYLSEIERGRKEASSEVLAAAVRALGLSLADLLTLVQDQLIRTAEAERRWSRPAPVDSPSHLTSGGTGSPEPSSPDAAAPAPANPGAPEFATPDTSAQAASTVGTSSQAAPTPGTSTSATSAPATSAPVSLAWFASAGDPLAAGDPETNLDALETDAQETEGLETRFPGLVPTPGRDAEAEVAAGEGELALVRPLGVPRVEAGLGWSRLEVRLAA